MSGKTFFESRNNKMLRIRVKTWIFRLSLNVFEAVSWKRQFKKQLRKLSKKWKKKNNFFFIFLMQKSPTLCQLQTNLWASSNVWITKNLLPQFHLERFLGGIKSQPQWSFMDHNRFLWTKSWFIIDYNYPLKPRDWLTSIITHCV